MKRIPLIVAFIVLAGGAAWWLFGRRPVQSELALYGDVDLRQVELAFNDSERIASVLVQEGDRVKRGQVLARLDTNRLEPEVAEAEATAGAQHEAVERLRNGSRPQEIAEPKRMSNRRKQTPLMPADNTSGEERSPRIRW